MLWLLIVLFSQFSISGAAVVDGRPNIHALILSWGILICLVLPAPAIAMIFGRIDRCCAKGYSRFHTIMMWIFHVGFTFVISFGLAEFGSELADTSIMIFPPQRISILGLRILILASGLTGLLLGQLKYKLLYKSVESAWKDTPDRCD
jgi:hypothetical protein